MHLAHSNDRLEHVLLTAWLDAADVGICVADDAGKVVLLNAAGRRHLGVDGLAMPDRSLRGLFGAFDQCGEIVSWIGASGGASRRATRRTDAGRVDLLLKREQVLHADGERFCVIALTDVTEMIAAEQRLADAAHAEAGRRQWQALNAGVVIVDALQPDMPIVYVNPMFERMSGYTAAEVVGRNCRFLQAGERDQPELADIRRAVATGSNGYAVLRNYRKDGSGFVNELFVSPIRDKAGRVVQFIGIQHERLPE